MNVKPNAGQNGTPDTSLIGGGARSRAVDRRTGSYAAYQPARPTGAADLSTPAQEFVKTRDRLERLEMPTRAERISKLRELVAAGAYRPDAGAIADAILRDPAAPSILGVRADAR